MITLSFYGNKHSRFYKNFFPSFCVVIYFYSRRLRGKMSLLISLFILYTQRISAKVTLIWAALLISFLSLEIFGNPENIKVKLNSLYLKCCMKLYIGLITSKITLLTLGVKPSEHFLDKSSE